MSVAVPAAEEVQVMAEARSISATFGFVYLITYERTGQRNVGQTTVNPFAQFDAHLSKPSRKMRKVIASCRLGNMRFADRT